MRTAVFGLIMLSASALPSASSQSPQASIADWQWLGDAWELALEAVMPMKLPVAGLLAYRSHDNLNVGGEAYFVVGYAASSGFDSDRLSATVHVPSGRTIRQQLLDVRMKDRAASFDTALSQVVVRRVTLDVATCPSLLSRMNALKNVVIRVPERGLMSRGHPPVHRVVLREIPFRMDVTLTDPSSPLVRWAIQTHEALLVCARKQGGPSER
jgi:hypothetical protein